LIVEIASIYYVYYTFLRDTYSFYYLTIAVALPLAFAAYKTIKAISSGNFGTPSAILKLAMIGGMGYSFIICLQL
jgi:hypothetical protein